MVTFNPMALVPLFLTPSSLLLVVTILALAVMALRPNWKLGWRLATIGLSALLICGLSPLGNALILPLENRFASFDAKNSSSAFAGIILLGGFEDGWVSGGRRGLAVNESAERLTEGVRLARQFPNTKLVFTGGVGEVIASHSGAAEPVANYLADVGVSPERIIIEQRSRNTFENALFTYEILNPRADQTWLLVTSAYHMPRAVGVFRKAGFNVVGAPVDFRTRGSEDLFRPFKRLPNGLGRVDVAVREWLGLLGYYALGRTHVLFPEP